MKDKKLTQSEIRQIQLEMLDEVDTFCRANNIRYSLAFGTLLGAVRHKGYIPWDDDMDIIMPLPDMIKFKKLFKSEKIKYLDIDAERQYDYDLHFSRVCYLPTYNKKEMFAKSYGVNIDIYPVVGMPDTEEKINLFLKEFGSLNKKRKFLFTWRRRLRKYLFLNDVPGYDAIIRKCYDFILNSYPYEGAKYYLHAGSVRWDNIFNFDVFEKLVDYEFEGRKYIGLERYDDYLSHCYGDYMKLPPEDQRHPYHHRNYYWKH